MLLHDWSIAAVFCSNLSGDDVVGLQIEAKDSTHGQLEGGVAVSEIERSCLIHLMCNGFVRRSYSYCINFERVMAPERKTKSCGISSRRSADAAMPWLSFS